jgi:Zn-dependent M28 family amino/carboxypeptidase
MPTASATASQSVPPTTPHPTPPPTSEAVATPAFDASEARAIAQFLANEIGIRASGTDGDVATRAYLQRAFEMRGWLAEQVTFDLPQGGTSANVIATWGGRGRHEGPVIVVGGHHDTKPNTVGANDNASGVGVVVALAGALAGVAADLEVPVMLVAFGAEEFQQDTGVHHIGSEALASEIADRAIAMLSVDMIGNGPTTRVVAMDGRDLTLQRRLLAVADTAGIADVVADVAGDISDHGPFARRGVPAAFLWTGDDGRLHTPADTFEHLEVADVQRAGDLTLAWLLGISADDAAGLRPEAG